jgi:hypothetical protein
MSVEVGLVVCDVLTWAIGLSVLYALCAVARDIAADVRRRCPRQRKRGAA